MYPYNSFYRLYAKRGVQHNEAVAGILPLEFVTGGYQFEGDL